MRLPPDRSILVVATAFGLFFVAAIAALTLIPPGSKIAPLWPATTLGVAVLLRMARGRGEAAAGLVGIALASILANTLVGKPWPLVLGFCIINTAEAALAAALARRFTSGTFKTLSDGWRFFAAAGPPAILMGGAGAYLLGRWVHPQAAVEMGVSFVASHLLGFTLAAPLAMTISRRELARLELRRRWLELSLVLALVLAAAMASFAQHSLPLLFATMPFALIATFRFRLLGANAAVLIIAAVAIPFTYAASGPLALVSAGGVSLKIAVLQAFLAATGLTVVPIAATLSERDRLGHLVQRQAEAHAETNRLLTRTLRSAEFAERAAGVGYWRMEYPSGAFMWSAGSYAIFERDPGLAPPHLSDLVLSVNRAEQEAVLAAFTHALANRTGFEADHSVVRPSGEVRHVHTRARFVDDEGPSRGVMLGVMVDVTDRTRAETAAAEASANYRLLAENATDVVIRYAAEDGRVLFVSPACEALIGLPPSDFIGRNSIGFVHEDDRARVAGAFARLASGELSRLPEPLEYRVRHADGRWVWVAGNPAPVRDPVTGWLENLVDVLRDVSARRALEDELIASREAAEAAARAKSDFLANMSHELRTPLSSIVGFSGLIAEAPELAPETRRRAALVAGASRSLVAVVNDVLEVSRFESEGVVLNPEPAHLGQVLGEAVELVRHDAESKGLELRFLPPASDPPVLMDASRVRQIALNLLGNAVKFTQSGSVTLQVSEDARGRAKVSVRDTGVGIPSDRLEAVFDRFAQADASTSRKFGGTGLGLTISRTLIEAMGGEIGVHSVQGHGATFWFAFDPPAATPLRAAASPSKASAYALTGLRVLVADDQALNRDLFRALTEGLGLDVTEACDGAQAVEAVRNARFDAVFMDVQMPVMSGLEATREIRRLGFTDLPVIALTANALHDEIERTRAAGMAAHLAKPYSRQEIVDLLSPRGQALGAAEEGGGLRALIGPVAFAGFLTRLDAQLQTLVPLLAARSARPGDLVRECHSARGVAATLGFGDLAAALGELERVCDGKAPARLRAALQAAALTTTQAVLADLAGRLAA